MTYPDERDDDPIVNYHWKGMVVPMPKSMADDILHKCNIYEEIVPLLRHIMGRIDDPKAGRANHDTGEYL